MTPRLKISPYSMKGAILNNSGGKKPGVPALLTNYVLFIFSAKPKSTSLLVESILLTSKIFSSLRSLCT